MEGAIGIKEAPQRESQAKIPTPEDQERLSTAKLNVHFDRGKMAEMQDPKHGLRPNLVELVDTVSRLPENLSFQPGITLLVGDNGSGKTAIAKAIQCALKEDIWRKRLTADNEDGVRLPWVAKLTPEQILVMAYNLTYKSNTGDAAFANRSAGLAPDIAQTITVDANYSTEASSGGPYTSGEYCEFPILLAEGNARTSRFYAGEKSDRDHLTGELTPVN